MFYEKCILRKSDHVAGQQVFESLQRQEYFSLPRHLHQVSPTELPMLYTGCKMTDPLSLSLGFWKCLVYFVFFSCLSVFLSIVVKQYDCRANSDLIFNSLAIANRQLQIDTSI
jgi:hypothetical protein